MYDLEITIGGTHPKWRRHRSLIFLRSKRGESCMAPRASSNLTDFSLGNQQSWMWVQPTQSGKDYGLKNARNILTRGNALAQRLCRMLPPGPSADVGNRLSDAKMIECWY
jgi:hypothetical protein